MNAQFFKTNKDIFLKYFEDSRELPASIYYDKLINDGRFETMLQIIRPKVQQDQESINKIINLFNER